ncbi:hypothetical protein ACIO08_08040 [Avibacterium paragallinarum]|uniref:hypothetical protein n=1 Tax=Avibacterium paragallinarum TaxID=728 RepID=UPI00397C7D61
MNAKKRLSSKQIQPNASMNAILAKNKIKKRRTFPLILLVAKRTINVLSRVKEHRQNPLKKCNNAQN